MNTKEKPNYFDLTDGKNKIEDLSIKKIDNFECCLIDKNNLIYKGFKLAQSQEGKSFTICDISFQKSATDSKYQSRLIFKKTDENLNDKNLRADCNKITISFEKGQNGYREFWRMISFLYKFNETVDLEEFKDFFSIMEKDSASILKKLAEVKNKNTLLENINNLSIEDLDNFGNLVNIKKIENILKVWEDNKNNTCEEFWQKMFGENQWIISQIFACPFVFLLEKFYCGGKEDDDRGGVRGDMLYENNLTGNLAFVEIKTPKTALVASKYRGEKGKKNIIYSMSLATTGSVNQVLNQKKVYLDANGDKKWKYLYNIKCILIIGSLPEDEDHKSSFELYRSSLRDVEIITYDELFKRVKMILEIFEKSNS